MKRGALQRLATLLVVGALGATAVAQSQWSLGASWDVKSAAEERSSGNGIVISSTSKDKTLGTVLIALGAAVVLSTIGKNSDSPLGEGLGDAIGLIFGGGLIVLGAAPTPTRPSLPGGFRLGHTHQGWWLSRTVARW